MPRIKHTCQPGEQCFSCPYPDCNFSGDLEKTGVQRKDGTPERHNVGNFSPVKGSFSSVDNTVKTTTVSKAVIEEMLVRQYGRKLEPVTGTRKRTAPRAK